MPPCLLYHATLALRHKFPTHVAPGFIIWPTGTFVNCVHTTEITQYLRQFGIPLTDIFPRVVRKLAHNNGCGPLPYKGRRPMH